MIFISLNYLHFVLFYGWVYSNSSNDISWFVKMNFDFFESSPFRNIGQIEVEHKRFLRAKKFVRMTSKNSKFNRIYKAKRFLLIWCIDPEKKLMELLRHPAARLFRNSFDHPPSYFKIGKLRNLNINVSV